MSGQPFLLRKATPADQPRITAIRMAVTENVLSDPSKVSDEEVAWYREQAIFLVAEVDGVVAGFTCANHQTGLIWALFLDRDFERRGIGRALLDAALASLAEAGHRQAWLTTGAGTRAERFYRAHGWRDMGREPGGQIVFVKPLN
ncbi:MAG: GNAT family N-acetyltransferase [Bosea sp. (in: a-proteobacteria)]